MDTFVGAKQEFVSSNAGEPNNRQVASNPTLNAGDIHNIHAESWQVDAAEKGKEMMKYHTLNHENGTSLQNANRLTNLTSEAKNMVTETIPEKAKQILGTDSVNESHENLQQPQRESGGKTLNSKEQNIVSFQNAKSKMENIKDYVQEKGYQAKEFITSQTSKILESQNTLPIEEKNRPQYNRLQQWQIDAAEKGKIWMKYQSLRPKTTTEIVKNFVHNQLESTKNLISRKNLSNEPEKTQFRRLPEGVPEDHRLQQWQIDAAHKGRAWMTYRALYPRATIEGAKRFFNYRMKQAKSLFSGQQKEFMQQKNNIHLPEGVPEWYHVQQWQLDAANRGRIWMKYSSLYPKGRIETISQFFKDRVENAKHLVYSHKNIQNRRLPEGMPEGYHLQQWQLDAAQKGRTWMRYQSFYPKGKFDVMKKFVQNKVGQAKNLISKQYTNDSLPLPMNKENRGHLPEGVPQNWHTRQWQIDACERGQIYMKYNTLHPQGNIESIKGFVQDKVLQVKNFVSEQTEKLLNKDENNSKQLLDAKNRGHNVTTWSVKSNDTFENMNKNNNYNEVFDTKEQFNVKNDISNPIVSQKDD